MPIFEYRCAECGHQFEMLVRGETHTACPECGATQTEKLFSVPAAHVPGTGSLPVTSSCPPSDAPPCGPGCCRMQ